MKFLKKFQSAYSKGIRKHWQQKWMGLFSPENSVKDSVENAI